MSMESWTRRSWLALTAGVMLGRTAVADETVAAPEVDDIPRPAAIPPVPREELAASIRRGVFYRGVQPKKRSTSSWRLIVSAMPSAISSRVYGASNSR